MVKEFRNSTDDSNKGCLGRYESAGPSNAPGRDAGSDRCDDGDNEEDPEEDHEEKIDWTEAQEKGVVCEG